MHLPPLECGCFLCAGHNFIRTQVSAGDRMSESLPNSYAEILTPDMMVLGDGSLGDDQVMRAASSRLGLGIVSERPQRDFP